MLFYLHLFVCVKPFWFIRDVFFLIFSLFAHDLNNFLITAFLTDHRLLERQILVRDVYTEMGIGICDFFSGAQCSNNIPFYDHPMYFQSVLLLLEGTGDCCL
jgi:hypothetical protein